MKANDKVICIGKPTKTLINRYYSPRGLPEIGKIYCIEKSVNVDGSWYIGLVGFPLVNKQTGRYGAYSAEAFKLLGRVKENSREE